MRAVALVFAAMVGLGSAALVVTPIIPKEDQLVSLDCPGTGNLMYWLLHGRGKAYEPLSQSEEFTVYNNGTISFESVKVYHAGTHLCVRETGGEVMAYPVDLEVRSRPSDDLWNEVYKYKFATGLIAAFVCCAIFGLSCLVYKKRWRPEERQDTAPIVTSGYDNPTLTKDEENGESTHIDSPPHTP
ncbi:uncharacterized protein LOC122248881 [Penaeus japonicus]|uniref:uncharacterized protein LOC122248881 n=1 Tax=Penaeus japonicus TaxID=27405 RepID=UPI001C714B71|nr:uncharacterized protein LOC122248881 [Penaeus japonicus]